MKRLIEKGLMFGNLIEVPSPTKRFGIGRNTTEASQYGLRREAQAERRHLEGKARDIGWAEKAKRQYSEKRG